MIDRSSSRPEIAPEELVEHGYDVLYKFFGGDFGAAATAIYHAGASIINSVSDWVLTIPAVHDILST